MCDTEGDRESIVDIITRIIRGDAICDAEIRSINASHVRAWVQDTDSHHDPGDCKIKNCPHRPGQITSDWAATLESEAGFSCTCGQHGTFNPDARDRAWGRFSAIWSQDTDHTTVKG